MKSLLFALAVVYLSLMPASAGADMSRRIAAVRAADALLANSPE